ncbi:amino acid adenylation domain-containing protein, partial [Myxococcus sp. AM011]|uniref:non-ribosomal peptide synthetase n=1 Tax=Myxococcus sp. AM011 TaxID=2745200 RepID=UPI001595F7FD
RLVSRLRATFQVELPLRALFEASTLSVLAQRIDAALQAGQGVWLPPLTRAPRTDALPLSFAQQRLWFLDQLEPSSAAYNMPAALRLTGALEVSSLQRALSELVRRHESLRTSFRDTNGRPVQVISPPGDLSIPVVDLSAHAAREAEVRRLAEQDASSPFNLATSPLLRTTLVRLSGSEHVLLLNMHHIITDGWSMGVLVREVAALYEAFSVGQPSPLPELPVQYADFAVWQRSWLQGEVLAAQLDWWRKHLEGAPALLELPTDRPRPATRTYQGATQSITLPRELSESLTALGRREGVTPFMLLLAAFQVLLSRYSGQDDITVGSPIAGRRMAELEGLIGFFVNTLVLRTRLHGDSSFREVLASVKETTLGAFAHQDIPFEKLVEELAPERSLGHSPLFQVMFALQNVPAGELQLPGLTLRQENQDSTTTKFDLTLLAAEEPRGLRLTAEYSTALFDDSTVARLLGHLQTLLRGAVARPEARLSELPLLEEPERHTLIREWNGARADYPPEACLHTLIEAQVEHTPDAVALAFEGATLTYRQLDERANQLAWHLRSLGVGPEVRVGLFLERSLEMVVALLATLKAGGAYVPFDPAYPAQRLAWMLEDTTPPVLLTQQHLLANLPPHSAQVLCLDTEWSTVARRRADRLAPLAGPDALAYVIFTSGSTGRPKGAMNAHRAVVNRLLWMQDAYGLTAADTVLQKTPFSFDVSVWEFFWPLMTGARLVVAKPGGHQDPTYLVRLIAEETVTTLHFVPSMLQAFLEEPGLERCTSLQRVVCSGEALPLELARRCLQRLPGAGLHNLYGPTEAAVDVSFHPCVRDEPYHSVPIGRPVANTQLRLLDAHLRPVPIGVPGELFIGGVQVGRGYLGRPELTAERFVPDDFSDTPGARLYRTGDLARWRSDGTVEYLGRVDFQVKLRGFRIELGEIEAALRTLPDVADTVVVVREDGAAGARLVAYLVPAASVALDTQALRASLTQRLPGFMVPSAFVTLPALPLSPSGKVDRKALPAPEASHQQLEQAFVAPRNAMELEVARAFEEVLDLNPIGARGHFFELGGHSLLATQLVSRVREAFQVELPLRALFEAPTVEQLALRIQARQSTQVGDARVPALTRASRDGVLPLSFAQQRLWFLHQLEPGSAFYNVPIVLTLRGVLSEDALERGFQELVRRHESLRTVFRTEGGAPVQVILPGGSAQLERVDLRGLPEAERQAEARRRAEQEAMRPFDLETGPLLRTTLLKLAAEEHLLVLVQHHIVSDGWSMGVLVREMAAHYAAFRAGQPSPLPELPAQYADYAVWQRSWLQGETLDAQLSWWRKHLEGAPAALELPTDRPRPAIQSFRGALHTRVLPSALADSLQALGHREGTTLFMVLLAGFEVVLSRYSGQEDFVIGTDIANRNRAETEGLIGFFINQLALRAQVGGDPSFRELLGRVRATALDAYAHQDLPFEELVRVINPERSLGRAPLFQVKLVLQNQPTTVLKVPGLTFTPEGTHEAASRLDLTLSIIPTAQGLACTCEYRTDLFEPATIDRLMRHLGTVLEAAAARPETPVSCLPLLSEEEQRQVLVEWNATARDFPRESCIHHLFEAQARDTPDAVALRFGDDSLTYAQLDARANQLAHHLRSLGIGPDTLVALFLERSLALVTAMLGVLKAGGAFVPLDPTYPSERLGFMLADSAAPVVITLEHLADELPSRGELYVLLDADERLLARQPRSPPDSRVTAESLAYVLYTSGSTGRPKGVMVTQRGIAHYLAWALQEYRVSSGQSAPVHTSVAFDATLTSLFAPLLAGGSVHLLPSGNELEALAQSLRTHRHGLVKLTPAHLQALLDLMSAQELALQEGTFVVGGEALPAATVERWRRLAPRVRLINEYGPTETVVGCSIHDLNESGLVHGAVPIGRPIANTALYILDARLRPVPVGVTGELYIGGAGVARGYLRRPELTAERFIPDAFSTVPGARLYRTGDLARFLPDGRLDFLGRRDGQVKLRGFRIELGEVESALRQFSQVREAVAVVREDSPGDKRLVAYLVAPGADVSALRDALRQKLPEYLVPSVLVLLDALPLTANGKVDRRALPVPELRTAEPESFAAPHTPTEHALAAIFREVLNVSQVGLHDDFFELGGHSLLATQLISRVREAFQVELPLRALFAAPTVEQLAPRIETLQATGEGDARMPALTRASRDGVLPLSFAQQRLWFLHQLEPGSAFYNVPIVLTLKGALSEDALERSFQELVRRHESLRTVFRTEGGAPVQIILPVGSSKLERVDLSSLPEAERQAEARRRAEQEAVRPFDLETGPLLRTTLLKLAADEHLLVLNMHHIVSDGWSMGVVVREMGAIYEGLRQGRPVALPELPVQYVDYAVWQRGWLKGAVLEEQLGWWKQHLSGAPPVLELPTDRPRPAFLSYRGDSYPVRLPRRLSEALKALCQKEGVTPFMALLAVYQLLLSRYSGQEDITVGSPIAGRRRGELEGLIGFFINTLVLRTRLEGNVSFRQLLASVKETTLGAFAHQDIPFEKLVEELAPERSLGRTPLFQVMFVLQNLPTGELHLPGITLHQEKQEHTTTKFDLTLALAEGPDGFGGGLTYSTDLFDPATAARLMRHFQVLLEAVTARPDTALRELPLLTPDERHQVLVDWNDTRADFPREATLHSLFQAQARRTPGATALVSESATLTYRQLDEDSTRLALHLRSLGAGPDTRVALCLERSCELVVAILAILKAGAAWVPLDPEYPSGRLAFMFKDCGAKLLLTRSDLLQALPSTQVPLLRLDALDALPSPQGIALPEPEALSPAYVIYTSGSTGLPKGVQVAHRAVINHLHWRQRHFPMGPQEAFLQKASFSFDISVWEMFAPLLTGARLVLARPGGQRDSEYLVRTVRRHAITHLHFGPAPLSAFLQTPDVEHCQSLRFVFCGGEPLTHELHARFGSRLSARLVHQYGPTEACIDCTAWECPPPPVST